MEDGERLQGAWEADRGRLVQEEPKGGGGKGALVLLPQQSLKKATLPKVHQRCCNMLTSQAYRDPVLPWKAPQGLETEYV